MQLLFRLFFGLIILLLDFIIIELFPSMPFLSDYELDLKILIPFLALLFLDPFLEIFNPYLCKIETEQKEIDSEGVIIFTHTICYKGQKPIQGSLMTISSRYYNIKCNIPSLNQEFLTLDKLKFLVSKEQPFLNIEFTLTPKGDEEPENITEITYKLNYLKKRVKL